jgi:hypothetical protein
MPDVFEVLAWKAIDRLIAELPLEKRLEGLSDAEIVRALQEQKARAAGTSLAGGGGPAGPPTSTPGRGNVFRLDPWVATAGTHLIGLIDLPPASVIGRFGRAGRLQRNPCTARWPFVSARDEVFVLYESGSTSAAQRGLLDPDDFWALTVPKELSIGGHRDTDLAGIERWLALQVEEFQRTGQRGPDVPEDFGREYVLAHLKDCTPEERLAGLSVEERLEGIPRKTLEEVLRRMAE